MSFPVPLKSIEVEVKVNDHVATVSSTLQYENKEEQPLEAIFVFPLPAEAAVCHFSAKIGETEVVAHVQEKKKVRACFNVRHIESASCTNCAKNNNSRDFSKTVSVLSGSCLTCPTPMSF